MTFRHGPSGQLCLESYLSLPIGQRGHECLFLAQGGRVELREVVSKLGYTGPAANVGATAALDPKETKMAPLFEGPGYGTGRHPWLALFMICAARIFIPPIVHASC
jgi:hypothetical protein